MPPRRLQPASRFTLALASLAALAGAAPARAAFSDMPDGGTSWIEVLSNNCDLGVPANGSDCFGASNLLPHAQYLLEPPGQLFASGSVTPNRITLDQNASNPGGGGFVWGATGGLFTLHGLGDQAVPVTVTMAVKASIAKAALTQGSVNFEMRTWVFGAVASELNQRVVGTAHGGRLCSFNACAGGVQLNETLTLNLSVRPGQTFNMGFQLITSSLTINPSAVSIAAVADLALSAGQGFYITGTNGYDSRNPAVPEPGTWAMLLAGVAVVALRRRTASA